MFELRWITITGPIDVSVVFGLIVFAVSVIGSRVPWAISVSIAFAITRWCSARPTRDLTTYGFSPWRIELRVADLPVEAVRETRDVRAHERAVDAGAQPENRVLRDGQRTLRGGVDGQPHPQLLPA